jgi:hypothetical protein
MCLIVAQPVAWILVNDNHAQTYILVFKALKGMDGKISKIEIKQISKARSNKNESRSK